MPPHAPAYAVLVSGRGSNLGALLAAHEQIGAMPRIVVSSRADAPALDIAREAGVRVAVIDGPAGASREARDALLSALLRDADVEWVILAGWMRILSDGFVRAWYPRLINIHPSLLPSFPGLHPHRQALARGVFFSGCTVHRVEPGDVDGGEILAQAVVPVMPDDTEAALAARILAAEHRLYPETVARLLRTENPSAS